MKTDSFFYRFFSLFPAAFFVLIGQSGRKAKKYKFASVEIKEQQEIIIELLLGLLLQKLKNLTREEVRKMVEPMLSDIKESRFYMVAPCLALCPLLPPVHLRTANVMPADIHFPLPQRIPVQSTCNHFWHNC